MSTLSGPAPNGSGQFPGQQTGGFSGQESQRFSDQSVGGSPQFGGPDQFPGQSPQGSSERSGQGFMDRSSGKFGHFSGQGSQGSQGSQGFSDRSGQGSPYQVPQAGVYSMPSPRPHRSSTGAIILLVIGALLTLSGPVLGILAGSMAMLPSAFKMAEDITEVSPTGTVTLEAGESMYLLGPVVYLDRLDSGSCSATGLDGSAATVKFAPASALNTLVSGDRFESFAELTAGDSGTYHVTCRTGDIPVIASPAFTVRGLLSPLVWGSIGGAVLSLVGIVMVIVGIVRLTRNGK